ncbi:hypothetical protein OG874_30185 [Nocardia sp. NBC_00565]|uniref:hypothetical protein n=1 Tax=Nocardia sp. NBC_00565 TaxID=2975993 RepID=UPI002E80595E|nr:hypothetical protein [Nocardia sp. NBC_00565]WUC01070.1 hypothetical protein OG874_30185 [Nocardia sp. NBC_00565]
MTNRAIEDYNTGNLPDLVDISCGQLRSELDNTDADAFAAGARSDLDARGRGRVTGVSDVTVLQTFASAAVGVRYERHAAGLNDNNEALFSAVYEKIGDIWRICGLS